MMRDQKQCVYSKYCNQPAQFFKLISLHFSILGFQNNCRLLPKRNTYHIAHVYRLISIFPVQTCLMVLFRLHQFHTMEQLTKLSKHCGLRVQSFTLIFHHTLPAAQMLGLQNLVIVNRYILRGRNSSIVSSFFNGGQV